MKESSDKPKAKQIVSVSFMAIFFALSFLIIGESATPSGASGEQSSGLSAWIASIVNAIFPPQKAEAKAPIALDVASTIPSYQNEKGEKVTLFDETTAIAGTTRMFTYTLTFPEDTSLYSSDVQFMEKQVPEKGCYTKTLSPSTKGGAIRIIPLKTGHYSFLLKDAGGNEKELSFECTNRIAPSEILSSSEVYPVKVGETKNFPFALTFGNYQRDDESVHHYLSRFIDPTLAEFSSSNESIFTVSTGGAIKGVSEGEANLLFKGKVIAPIKVQGNAPISQVASIKLTSETNVISPLDYDYSKQGVGVELTPHFYNALNQEIFPDPTPSLRYKSEDPLIAMVENDRYEVEKNQSGEEELVYKKGGIVAGYRIEGNTNVTCYLEDNPSISSSLSFLSKGVSPSSVSFSLRSEGALLSDNAEIQAGNNVSVIGEFLPVNCIDKNIHVDLSPNNIAKVENNDTNSPTIALMEQGQLTVSVYSVHLGAGSKATFYLNVSAKPAVSEDMMGEFSMWIRKGAGHIALFAITAIFGFIGLYLSGSHKNEKQLILLLVAFLLTGFLLAGLSELIQAIPVLARGASWSDVGIDVLGYAIASLLLFAIFSIIDAVKRKKPTE